MKLRGAPFMEASLCPSYAVPLVSSEDNGLGARLTVFLTRPMVWFDKPEAISKRLKIPVTGSVLSVASVTASLSAMSMTVLEEQSVALLRKRRKRHRHQGRGLLA